MGGIATLVVAAIQAITKFTEGAWIVILIIPILVLFFKAIRRHYNSIAKWAQLGFEIPLEIINSPYRDIITPIMGRIHEIEDELPDDIVTVMIPEFVVKRWWQNFLHNQTALILKGLLFFSRKVVVVSIPYRLR